MATYRNPWVQSLEMVRAADDEDAVVALQAVDLVQEVASDLVVDE
jgi:hypothetical protein